MAVLKKIRWLGDSLKELKTFPEEVMDGVGYALHHVQEGLVPKSAKPLTGFKPAVMEIVSDCDSNTYRAVYTVKIDDMVYVLDCFQKKSKKGIETPKQNLDLIKQRLKEAEIISKNKRSS